MTALSATRRAGGFWISAANRNRSMETGILNAGQNLEAGTVLASITGQTSATAVGTPTGNGVITVGAPGPDIQRGTYKLVAVAAATNAGTFNFYAPDGSLIRQITVGGGAAANDHMPITIADGATDFVVGDTFTITVTYGDYTILAPAGTDGSQNAAAILWDSVNAVTDTKVNLVVRDAEVNGHELVWPSGITDANKNIAIARLAAQGIIIRN